MTARRDPEQLIHHFLLEGSERLHDQVYDAVRADIEQKRQRVVIGPWRMPDMNKLVPIGVAAAAVIVALVAGTRLLGSPAPGDVGGLPSVRPSVLPSSSVAPSVANPSSTASEIAPRPYVFSGRGGPAITVTIPAPGWTGDGGTLIKNDVSPPDGAGMIGPWYEPLFVYGDPCKWSTTTPKAPATTVSEIVAALTAQKSRNASVPVAITRDGYSGKSVTLHVPDDAVFGQCDQGFFGSWTDGSGSTPSRYHQGPGQIDEVLILDVGGKPMVFNAAYYKGTSVEDVAELHAILESMTFAK